MLLLSFSVISPAFCQGWERLYPNVAPQDQAQVQKILPAPGGGYLVLISESNYALPQDDLHLLKVDDNGAQEWVRHYDFGQAEFAVDLIATADGGYAMLYYDIVFSTSYFIQPHLLKLDDQFNVVFNQSFGPLVSMDRLYVSKLLETPNGYWIVGNEWNNGLPPQSGFLLHFDAAGNLLTNTPWGIHRVAAKSVLPTPDGGLLALGTREGNAPGDTIGILLARFDAAGALLWQKTIPAAYSANDFVPAPDGGYLIAGARQSDGLLVKTDDDGNVLWEQFFPAQGNPANIFLGIFDLAATTDGLGYWAVSGTNSYIPHIVLLRLDLAGNLLWSKEIPASLFTYTYGFSLRSTADQGCIIGGSYSPGGNPEWPYVVKTDSSGGTYHSGIAGKVSSDTDGDCIPDIDSLMYGRTVFAWKNGQFVHAASAGVQGDYQMALDTGDYQIFVDKLNNAWSFCPDTVALTVLPQDTTTGVDFTGYFNPQPVDSIFGYVFEDMDGDCVQDSFETTYPGWTILAQIQTPGGTQTFVAETDSSGYFLFTNLAGADNTSSGYLSASPPGGDGLNCTVTCPQAMSFQFLHQNSHEAPIGVHCDSLPPCPVMEVDIATNVLRPCQPSAVHVYYCNQGSVVAEDASIDVTVDAALTVTGSSIPWAAANGNVYTFSLGDLTPEQCGYFSLNVSVPCDEPAGTAYCFEAHGYPDTVCAPPGPDWDGSQIVVNATCAGDSVTFTIRNIGAGNMANPLEYIVVEDNVMLMQAPGQFQLNAGQEFSVSFPATGVFYRLEADQTPGFPVLGDPAAWVEGCGTSSANISLGFVNQYYLPDDEPWLDIFCLESVNSFDPNDKNGFPRGYGSAHFIKKNTDIEYLVRFQNTGTAPAIDIEIRDTIPVLSLDPLSVRPGASSHPYTWDMQGNGVVVFRFAGINLPDSSVSQEASQGFVKFRVSQRPDLPDSTVIRNTAAIYFDHNPPVITNETLHTIEKDFILLGGDGPGQPRVKARVMPNPASDRVRITLEGRTGTDALRFRLLDTFGREVLTTRFTGGSLDLDVRPFAAGVYYYDISDKWETIIQGKLVTIAF